MIPWFLGVVLIFGLLAGCGGSQVVKQQMYQPEVAVEPQGQELEETLAEELNPKRLEELCAKSGIPNWDPSLEEELKQWDQQLQFDVPIQTNRQVRAYLVYFSTERQQIIRRYLARSSRYLPMIKEVFQEYGLPEDLAYLAMIESGFNPHAYSHAAACGMWQFIRGTAARYGLAMDSYLDERRDPEKSTRAAARYLLDLYKQFGSWYLAAASYNCGENRVQRELDQSNHKSFWDLSANQCLPNETKNYVPQMIAATIIAKNPEKFGFKRVPYLPPIQYEKVKVEEPTSLKAAAFAINVPTEELQLLNPELRRGTTPPDGAGYTLNLPKGSRDLFAKNILLARVEFPGMGGGRYSRSSWRGEDDADEDAAPAAPRHRTAIRKAHTVVTRSKTHSPAQNRLADARKTKPAAGAAKSEAQAPPVPPAPQMASMLGTGGGSAKAEKAAAATKSGAHAASPAVKSKGKTSASKPSTKLVKKGKPAIHKNSPKKPVPATSAKKKDKTYSQTPKAATKKSQVRGKSPNGSSHLVAEAR